MGTQRLEIVAGAVEVEKSTGPSEGRISQDRDDILSETARLIWRREISIGDFHQALGVDPDDLQHSNTADVAIELSGIFKAWQNPPTEKQHSFVRRLLAA